MHFSEVKAGCLFSDGVLFISILLSIVFVFVFVVVVVVVRLLMGTSLSIFSLCVHGRLSREIASWTPADQSEIKYTQIFTISTGTTF